MPFRTKDFLLFLLAIMFFSVGGVSWSKSNSDLVPQQANLISSLEESSSETIIYQAVLPESKSDQRPSRLAALQGKIAQLFSDGESSKEKVREETITATAPEPVVSSNEGEIILCPSYARANISWNSANIGFVVNEGARILYRKQSPNAENDIASSTILQLPINFFHSNIKTCLNNDVVGIALEGSLMRNEEDNIYKIFGGETLLGYALDGFPIYGLDNNVVTDNCGGANVQGSYRYYLNDKRDGIIGCFSGSPISL
ncbi:MAG TPA: hypothetical protein PKA42_01820 [Candidatus Paceibacterota bacterium]|nr:hypothetical protein [Candidatus Paceibacterota bacterium]HMO82882.1 hypothetical protein [Candidatus Paceibacterota bacterium]